MTKMASEIDHKQANSKPQDNADEKAKKEELVEARIQMMRKKNEELMKRQQEIEEDRRNANKYSEMVVIKKHVSGVIKESPARGRGRGRGLMLEEMRKETLKAKQWEAKRRENVLKEEQERNQRSTGKTSTFTCSSTSRFLADDSRVDMSRTSGRNEHSWGGANFNKAVNRMQREKEGSRSGTSKGNMEMSGKERRQYYQWREERTKIDEERKARQKKAGNWSRAWDQRKIWDSRKKMWVYEDVADDHHERRRRWQESDSSEDWGNGNRSSRMDNRGPGRGEQGSRQGFSEQRDQEIEATEDWGDTSEKTVVENKLSGSKTKTGNTLRNQPSTAVGGLGSTDWEEKTPTLQEKENSCIGKEALSDHPQSDALSSQRELKHTLTGEVNGSVANDQRNNSGDSDKSQECSTEVMSDAPKPQKEPTQRKLSDTVVSEKEKGLATEKMPTSHENDVLEPPSGDRESDVTDKVYEHIHKECEATSDHLPSDDGDDKGSTSLPVDELQETTNLGHSVENVRTNEGEDNVSNMSQARKANLPKLVTKIDKKVTFDTEENDGKTDSESKEITVSLDIPPTPDFLKIDHGVDWGDIEVDEDEVVERWQ